MGHKINHADPRDKSTAMLTPAQSRAARGFLNWTLADLAQASGISRASLNSFESGNSNLKADTMSAIQQALEAGGIEFTDEPGVRLKGQKLEVWRIEGDNVMQRFFDDVYQTRLKMGGELLSTGLDETKYETMTGDPGIIRRQIKKWQALGFKERAILQDGDRHFVFPPDVTTYRWTSPDLFGLMPTVTYGNKHAIVVYGPPISIVITESDQVAEMYRKQFDVLWALAKPLPFTDAEVSSICEKNLPLED